MSSPNPRPLRADAQRNRDHLLAIARAALAAAGADVTHDRIAQYAGVGIGTRYRHFPTRDALVEAIYAAELDAVVADADPLLAALPADQALREWMNHYARFTVAKRGMLGILRAGWASGRIATPATRERITAVIASMLAAGAADGTLRTDVDPDDVVSMLVGVFLSSGGVDAADGFARTDRLLDLLIDGLRPRVG